MDEEFDVYGDLDEFDYKLKYTEQIAVINQLQSQLEDALTKLAIVEREKQVLTKRADNMGNSFQSLLNTAKAEIKRKDAQIDELRREKDNIIFRRGNPGQKRGYLQARPTSSSEIKAEPHMSELNGGESLPPSRANPFRRQSRDQRAKGSPNETRPLNLENRSVQFCDLTYDEDKNNDCKILSAEKEIKKQNTAKVSRVLDKPKIVVDLCNNGTDISDEDIKVKTEALDLSKAPAPQLNATHGTKQVPTKDRVIVKEEQVEPARTNSRPINETDRFNRKSRDQRLNKDDAVHLPSREYRIKNERNSPEGNSREINSREKNPTETSVRDSYNSKERHDRKYELKEIDLKEHSSRSRDRSYFPKEIDHRDTKLRNTKDTITDDRYRRDSDKKEITDRRSRESRDQHSKDDRNRQQYKSQSLRERDRYDDRKYDRDVNKKSQDYADKNYKSTTRERRNSRSDRRSSKDERSRRDYGHVDDSEMRSLKRRHDSLEESSSKRQRTHEEHNRRGGRTRSENRKETETKKPISNLTTEKQVREPATNNHEAKERRKNNDNVAEESKNDRESGHSKISAHPYCMENASEKDLLQMERKLQEEIFGAANDPESYNQNKYTEHTDDEIFNQDCGKIQQELSDGEIVDDDANYEVLPAVKAKSNEKCLDNSKSKSRDSRNGRENLMKKSSDPSIKPSKCEEQLGDRKSVPDPGRAIESNDVERCEQPKENNKLNATKPDDQKIEGPTVIIWQRQRKQKEPIKVTESKRQQKEETNDETNCTSLEPVAKKISIASSEQLPETVKRKTPLKTSRRISVNRNRKSISEKLNISSDNGILTLSDQLNISADNGILTLSENIILETIFPDSPTKPVRKLTPIKRNLRMEGHKIGFEPKKRSEDPSLDTSRELKNELFKEVLGPIYSMPTKTADETSFNDLNRSLTSCTSGHESGASNEKEAIVNAGIKENSSHSKEPRAEKIDEPTNATNADSKEESVSFDKWSTENNCNTSATCSSSGSSSLDNSTSHDTKESNALSQNVDIAKSNSEIVEKNKEIAESQAAGPVSFKTKKRKAMIELKSPDSEDSVLKGSTPEVVSDARELRNDEAMKANYSRDIFGSPETDQSFEEHKEDFKLNLRSSRDVIENVEQECNQNEIKICLDRLKPIESKEIRPLDYLNDSPERPCYSPIQVPDDQSSKKECEQYKIDQLANNESNVDDNKNSNEEDSVALDLTKRNSTEKADKKWEKEEIKKTPKFEILDMKIIQKGAIFEEINNSKDATELCDKINRALSRISESRDSPQTANEPTNESSNNNLATDEKRPRRRQSTTCNNDLNKSTGEKLRKRRQSTICNKSVSSTKSQPLQRTKRIERKPSTNGTRQLAEQSREDSSMPTPDSENLKHEEQCRQMEVVIEAFIAESQHLLAPTFDKSPDETRDTSTEKTTILDPVDQMTPSEGCKPNETLCQETPTESEVQKIDPVLDTLPAVTCTSSSNSQLDSSNSEKRNVSIASSNYVIETVSPNVVNVFITRKKVKKKKKS